MSRKAKEQTAEELRVVRPIEGGEKFVLYAWSGNSNVVVVSKEKLKQIVEQGMEFL